MHRFSKERAFSSAGLEHLPYKQRVGGSNPSAPTRKNTRSKDLVFFTIMLITSTLSAQVGGQLEPIGQAGDEGAGEVAEEGGYVEAQTSELNAGAGREV